VPLYSFGPFQVDSDSRRVTRGGDALPVSDRHVGVLLHLVAHAGTTVGKEALIEAGWDDVAVTDNSLEQAISVLRRLLADAVTGGPVIETIPRRGYRFAAPVQKATRRETDAGLDALLAPHRAWLEGQTALETLERERVVAAQEAFTRALQAAPDFAPPHVGLANAYVFRFEATRSEVTPDTASLQQAIVHAREACRLDPHLAEAWATLGFVLSRAGDADDALAAARRAVALEPDNWRHQLRLAFIGWGEERLRAATRALHLLPGLGLAHFLAATVHVARQAFASAERELEAGVVAQDAQRSSPSRFSAVGLHWLQGLVRLHAGDEAGARRAFAHELSFESAGHLYGAECCAHVEYALGALAWRGGDLDEALAAFGRALRKASGHLMPRAARLALAPDVPARREFDERLAEARAHGYTIDAAAAEGLSDVMRGERRPAIAPIERALATAPPGPQGWLLPVDPMLDARAHPDDWASALAVLRSRAA
jgi:DNA-binding winged helix-turn-helix (wHTH) protein